MYQGKVQARAALGAVLTRMLIAGAVVHVLVLVIMIVTGAVVAGIIVWLICPVTVAGLLSRCILHSWLPGGREKSLLWTYLCPPVTALWVDTAVWGGHRCEGGHSCEGGQWTEL